MSTQADKKETKRHRKPKHSYNRYVKKTLSIIDKEARINTEATDVAASIANDFLSRMAHQSKDLLSKEGKKTLTTRDLIAVARMTLPDELSKHAVSEMTKAVTKFNGDVHVKGQKAKSKSIRAGLTFPVGRITSFLRSQRVAPRLQPAAGVALTAGVEYIVSEIIELSNNVRKDAKKVRINARHVAVAVRNDEELSPLFNGTIARGGVLPNVNEKKRERQEKVAATPAKGKKSKK